MSVVDGVDVHHKNLILGVLLLHLDGNIGLAHLTFERLLKLLLRKNGVSHELLRNGGCTFRTAGKLSYNGTNNALGVNAVVLIKADVLHVYGAHKDVRGNLVLGYGTAVLEVVLGNNVIVGVENLRGLSHQIRVGGLVVG